jgi:hypothetical protein
MAWCRRQRGGRATTQPFFSSSISTASKHHLVVAHEVTNVGHDRATLASMAELARDASGLKSLTVVADRGYFDGEEIRACELKGITTYIPKPLTSGAKAEGRFGKQDFVYVAEDDVF